MIRVFSVPVQMYQASAVYASETGKEVYLNDLCIGEDSRAFIHSITVSDGKMKLTPVYLTTSLHDTIMDRCESDLIAVKEFMAEKVKEVHND